MIFKALQLVRIETATGDRSGVDAGRLLSARFLTLGV
jgi:hypothetical protein